MYVCMFFKDFSRPRALTEPKMVPYGMVVDNTLLRHFFKRSGDPSKSVARDRSSNKLNIMIRAVAATVARDLDSYSLLPKLKD